LSHLTGVMSTEPPARAWIEIRGQALRRNLRVLRDAAAPGTRLIGMVKADGYGLGALPIARILLEEGVQALGVACVEEGIRLRGAGFECPILVFSGVPPGGEVAALDAGLTLCISDLDGLERVGRVARERSDGSATSGTEVGVGASIHLEVDTGIGRAGFPAVAVDHWAPELSRWLGEGLRLTGIFTHFHSADEAMPVRERTMAAQRTTFDGVLRRLARDGIMPEDGPDWRHLANSAAILGGGSRAGEGVRPGIFLYGGGVGEGLPRPDPVIAVRARVVRTVDVPAGTTQGYGATYRAKGPERWATLGIGYGDGLPRILSNRGVVLVAGRRVPIIGRISMDVTVVDITELPGVQTGDVATVIGSDGGEEITVDEVAECAQTISYEILTGWTPRLRRRWEMD